MGVLPHPHNMMWWPVKWIHWSFYGLQESYHFALVVKYNFACKNLGTMVDKLVIVDRSTLAGYVRQMRTALKMGVGLAQEYMVMVKQKHSAVDGYGTLAVIVSIYLA